MAYLNNGKPFSDLDDVDDNTFLNHPRQGNSGYVLNDNSANSWEDKRRQVLDERRKIEEQTLQSTKTSLGLLYETEKVGLHTAEELLHQKEQLTNVNEKLDSINSIMRVSQKHLTSMKSIFGGVKNYFSKTTDNNQLNNSRLSTSASESKLQSTVETIRTTSENVNSQMNHPALRRKEVETSGFEEGSASNGPIQTSTSQDFRSRDIDVLLDQNLDEMGQGLGRLKELARGLGDEIESQNSLLDNLATKSERAQDTIANQNRQMKRILKS